jgi:hypothetical protein
MFNESHTHIISIYLWIPIEFPPKLRINRTRHRIMQVPPLPLISTPTLVTMSSHHQSIISSIGIISDAPEPDMEEEVLFYGQSRMKDAASAMSPRDMSCENPFRSSHHANR